MNTTAKILPSKLPPSFISSIWKDEISRAYVILGIGLSLAEFFIFKLLYPFPDFFSDSYSYLYAAYARLDLSIWPIGYSKFLAAFHDLTHSDTALVACQYFFVQIAALYFFLTILYFYPVSKWTRNVLFLFLFVNPLSLYLSNTINSDAIFAALSLWWFTELIWIVHRPKFYRIIIQAILLSLCFTVRNNAYYYPFIALIALVLSRQNWKLKIIGFALPFLFIIPFVIHTENIAFKMTGTRQFSLFTGWQLANNALYIYDQIDVDSTTLPTPQARELNRIALKFFRRINPDVYRDYLQAFVGNFFIRKPDAPLKAYYNTHYSAKNEIDEIRNWGKASVIFEPFGKTIILNHPVAYFRFFMLPNMKNYIMPPLSHLEIYNYGDNDIDPIAAYWFNYPKAEVHCVSHRLQGALIIYAGFFLLFNLYFLYELIRYVIQKGIALQKSNTLHATYWLTTIYIIVNFGFSIFATINILRYQIVPMILLLSFALLLSDYREEWQKKEQRKHASTSTYLMLNERI